ncbi:membrane protein, partial [Lacticaseibacillus rhamnosus MTCC 5462]
ILLSTKAVLVITTHWPLPSYGFFIGLVLGIGPFIYRKLVLKPFSWWYLLLVLGGFIAIYGLAKLGGTQPENLIAIQRLSSVRDAAIMGFSGIFAVSLMAIPGISGSVMLMVIDQYGTVYHAVSQLGDAARALVAGNWAGFTAAMGSVALLVPFMVGAMIGLIAIAKLMGYLLEHFEVEVYYAVCGIVAAAVVILIETGIAPYWPTTGTLAAVLAVLVSLVIGILATVFLDKPESDRDA